MRGGNFFNNRYTISAVSGTPSQLLFWINGNEETKKALKTFFVLLAQHVQNLTLLAPIHNLGLFADQVITFFYLILLTR